MSFSRTPPKKELLPFQKENVATNQQNLPLPYLAGTRVIAVRWFSPAIDQINVPAPSGSKKG